MDALQFGVQVAIDGLKKKKTEASLGYADMLVLVSYAGGEEVPDWTVTPAEISAHLNRHPDVPSDSKMGEPDVTEYLEVLANRKLIERVDVADTMGKKYEMRSDVASCVYSLEKEAVSGKVPDSVFAGFYISRALRA
jgi:hypothetical protein